MTADTERAKRLLEEGGYTCVLCRGDVCHTSSASGIAPMLEFIGSKTDLIGFCAADRIVGKAAAMLFVLAKVSEVYAGVMSRAAADMLSAHGIAHSCGVLTDRIINRRGDDICPMEKAVADTDDPEAGYAAIAAARKRLAPAQTDKK